MQRLLISTRYCILLPIIGLALAAVSFFILGGIGLMKVLVELYIDNVEELETNLIGVLVVVLAVDFLSTVFVGQTENLLQYGVGIALPVAALGLFIGLRAWSNKLKKEIAISAEEGQSKTGGERVSQDQTKG